MTSHNSSQHFSTLLTTKSTVSTLNKKITPTSGPTTSILYKSLLSYKLSTSKAKSESTNKQTVSTTTTTSENVVEDNDTLHYISFYKLK